MSGICPPGVPLVSIRFLLGWLTGTSLRANAWEPPSPPSATNRRKRLRPSARGPIFGGRKLSAAEQPASLGRLIERIVSRDVLGHGVVGRRADFIRCKFSRIERVERVDRLDSFSLQMGGPTFAARLAGRRSRTFACELRPRPSQARGLASRRLRRGGCRQRRQPPDGQASDEDRGHDVKADRAPVANEPGSATSGGGQSRSPTQQSKLRDPGIVDLHTRVRQLASAAACPLIVPGSTRVSLS